MASVLKVDALQGIASADNITVTVGTGITQSLHDGVAKTRCKWNGTGTVAINESFNVSSLDDNATGQYDVNYTNAFGTGNYTCLTSGAGGSGTSGPYDVTQQVAGYVNIRYYAGAYYDANTCNMANLGDLA